MSKLETNPLQIKGSDERAAIARQLVAVRTYERNLNPHDLYKDNRARGNYAILLEGLTSSLDYVKRLGSTNLVLDIGAGTTRAISQLSQLPDAQGLDFMATVLRYRPEIDTNLGRERTLATPAEKLRGIGDNSVGLALSVFSVTYSVNPEAVVDSIDRILVKGGIFKGRFNDDEKLAGRINLASLPYREFLKRFRARRYNIAISRSGVILAKKPGRLFRDSAQKILERDYESLFAPTAIGNLR